MLDDSTGPRLEYATLDRDLKRPRGPAPWWMYVRDVALAIALGSVAVAVIVGIVRLLEWFGVAPLAWG